MLYEPAGGSFDRLVTPRNSEANGGLSDGFLSCRKRARGGGGTGFCVEVPFAAGGDGRTDVFKDDGVATLAGVTRLASTVAGVVIPVKTVLASSSQACPLGSANGSAPLSMSLAGRPSDALRLG